MTRLAIDPGEKHVGVCFDTSGGELASREMSPGAVTRWLEEMADGFDEVIIESFKLYPGQDRKTVYRKMSTSELIGAIKQICRQAGVSVVEQDATIKKLTRRQLRARGIRQVGVGTHERDAELHYWYRRLREEENG